MHKYLFLAFVYFFLSSVTAFAFIENTIVIKDKVFYSKNSSLFYNELIDDSSISLTKSELKSSEMIFIDDSTCLSTKISSDIQVLYDGRLLGFDNKSIKIYELIYENNVFIEKSLNYEQLQELFKNIEVIKLSDFTKGVYNIITNGNKKEIILLNDKDENLENYVIEPEKYCIHPYIKFYFSLPKRGKITLKDRKDKTKKRYVIKVR